MNDLDRYALYELCVQSPRDLAQLLRAIHGGAPAVLGEDFCGTAALSAQWVQMIAGGRAIAVDHDPEPLKRAALHRGVETVCGDVVADTAPDRHRADVVYAGNFSIGERRSRRDLLAYLAHARSRLHEGGIFACDTYGGETAWLTGSTGRDHPLPDGRVARHTWEQRQADPTTGRVVNALHFAVLRDGTIEQELPDAFVYRWRLWSVPELRDAMEEAGFAPTEVYNRVPDARDGEGNLYVRPVTGAADLDDSFDVLVVGRT